MKLRRENYVWGYPMAALFGTHPTRLVVPENLFHIFAILGIRIDLHVSRISIDL